MVVKLADKWKEEKYNKLKGDKSEAFFKVAWDEAIIHETDESFIIAGYFTEYQGIVRAFKPENPITPDFCVLPVYGKDYEIRSKGVDGNWKSDTIKPSKFELKLHSYLENTKGTLWDEGRVYKGEVTHIPNAMTASMDGDALTTQIANNFKLELTTDTGKLPDYEPKKNSQRKNNGSYSKGLSPEEKLVFLKKTMEEDVKSTIHKQGQCLADLTDQIIKEHLDNPNFIEIYFDLLIACVR